ncbi:MAG TPA: septum formation inhibitor Maf [Candidatus Gallacutalibacter pullistercoris]|nr:septum formation inhibitor Maf [Candidatus Gallacutalibacter pullistercoris]
MEKIILASGSPRRRELLELAGVPFTVQTADVDESIPAGISPEEAVQLLAAKKARAIEAEGRTVLAADTVVALDGVIFGKPQSEEDAQKMLRTLSGKIHQVHTGVCIRQGTREEIFCETAQVEFYPLTAEEIERYVASGEPMDKAGAYGIQGKGALLVRRIEGDYYTIVGLPVARVVRMLLY